MCERLVLYPAKNEEIYGIVMYQKFSCHVTYIAFIKKISTCGSQVGHMRIVQWVKWVNRCNPLSTLAYIINLLVGDFQHGGLYKPTSDVQCMDSLALMNV